MVVVAVLRDERRAVRADRVTDAAPAVVGGPGRGAGHERRAGRAVLDGERGAAEGLAPQRAAVVGRQVRAVRVVVDGAVERAGRDLPRLGQRPVGLTVGGEDEGDRHGLAPVRVRHGVPRGLLDGDVHERCRVRGEVAVVHEPGLGDVDAHSGVVRVGGARGAGLPLEQRGEQAARPHRLIVRIQPPQAGVGRRGTVEDSDRARVHRAAGAVASDTAVAPGAAARVARVRVAVLREPEDDDEGRRHLLVLEARGDLRRTADGARRRHQARAGVDAGDLTEIDGERAPARACRRGWRCTAASATARRTSPGWSGWRARSSGRRTARRST